jgi:aspartyl-tRNA(Asn)/glutamyl-tRNA(Gln) amidotransferase subunit A
MGHTLVPMAFPEALTEYQALCGSIVAHEAYRQHRAVAEDPATPLDPHVRQRVLFGRDIDTKRYAELQAQRRTSVADFKTVFANVDAIALPGTPLPAIPVAEVDETTIPMSRYTRAANVLGLCAISLPNGSTAAGLPSGLQLVMIGDGDAALLDFAEDIAATVAAA